VLQTLAPNDSYRSSEPAFDEHQGINFGHYIDILKRRIFYFLLPFGLVSVLGFYVAAILKPNYLSEGKILVETQRIAPDLVRPILTATSNERIQIIQQRILTRDNLLSVARKFRLFPNRTGVVDLMREGTLIKPVEVEGQTRQGYPAIAFTVGFEYEIPEIAMKVANEFVTMIVDDDARSRTGRTTEAVKIVSSETKDIEDKLEALQSQIFEIERRAPDSMAETRDKERSQLTALAALKAELIQKTSVYSEAHPAVTALRKRLVAMEKSLAQIPPAPPAPADDIDVLRRQREALEKRLAEANIKLAAARLNERLDQDQKLERLQVIEAPSLPQKPLKSNRLKMVGIVLFAAAALGIGAVVATELLDGSIRGRHQLSGVFDSHLIVPIPYFTTRSDVIKAKWRTFFIFLTLFVIITTLCGLAAAILLNLPVDFSWINKAWASLRVSN
jgi:uncharacterized protein involved in exopolysaccharide biosynthesis